MAEKEKVLRNVSLEEIEALRQKDAVAAVQDAVSAVQETKPKKVAKIIDNNIEFKQSSSVFEPKSEPVKLPSRNFFVKTNLTPNYEIYVKRMGSVEEAIFYDLINTRDPQTINNAIDRVIDNCIKTNISVYDLSLIDKFTVFLKILDMTYGPIDVELTCPTCNNVQKLKLNLVNDIVTTYIPKDLEYPKKIHLTTYDANGFNLDWYVNYLTIGQTNSVLDVNSNIDSMILVTDRIEGTYTDADGEEVKPIPTKYPEILQYINDDDRETYRAWMQEIGGYGTNFEIKNVHCTQRGCIANTESHKILLPPEQIFSRIIRVNNVQV